MAAPRVFKMALAQLAVGSNKAENVQRAVAAIRKAADNGAKVVALPECFNCPYGTSFFPAYAETIPGTTTDALAQAAADANVYVIGGSIPEQDGDRIFNSCAVFSPTGDIIAKHRKVHLFDIDVPGKITFKESTTLTAGDAITVFDTPMCRFGVAICYDIRFPELTRLCADQGCAVMCFPGAFNMTTGPAHWELLLRARAVDNQMYVAGISPARDLEHSYHAWGHSTLVSPWGEVQATTEDKEDIIYADIDLDKVDEMRTNIPIRKQRRPDVRVPK